MLESQIIIYNHTLSALASKPPPEQKMVTEGLKWRDRVSKKLQAFFKEPNEPIELPKQTIDLYAQYDALKFIHGPEWTPGYDFKSDELSLDLTNTILSATDYLLKIFPKLPLEKDTPISSFTKSNYLQEFNVVNDPSSVIDHLLMGFLGRAEIITLGVVYPELLEEIRVIAVEVSLGYPKLTWTKRKQLNILLGTQISSLSYQAPEESKGRGGSGGSNALFKTEATELQKRESK